MDPKLNKLSKTPSYSIRSLFIRIIVIGFILLPAISKAQLIEQNAIDKIFIKNTSGGMGGSTYTVYEIKKINSRWVSARTKDYSGIFSPQDRKMIEKNSDERKFIKNIDPASINSLVFAINHPARSFNPASFGITAAFLRVHADSLCARDLQPLTSRQKAIFKQAIAVERVNKAILKTQRDNPTDVFNDCLIRIVRKNGDTLKIESHSLTDYKLPWIINNKDTAFNIAISRFCANAIGINGQYGGELLNGGDIYSAVYNDIYNSCCSDKFTAEFFGAKYRDAFKLLSSYYEISDIRTSDILQARDPIVFMKLHPPSFPKNVNINTALYVAHPNDVTRLIGFKSEADNLLKRKNFVFDFAARSPGYQLTLEDPTIV